MATLTIRNVETRLKEQLRMRAARHGHSMEAELRQILREALADRPGQRREVDLAAAIRRRFQPLGGLDDLEAHPPVSVGDAPVLDR
jgi:plasmid stability protein